MQDIQYGEKAERERNRNFVVLSRTLKSVANKAAVSENAEAYRKLVRRKVGATRERS